MIDCMDFQPRPSDQHRRKWARMILPTYEYRMLEGDEHPLAHGRRDHLCDFADGLRLLIYVVQAAPGFPEELLVNCMVEAAFRWSWSTIAPDQWADVVINRLVEIDLGGRPRLPARIRQMDAYPQGGIVAFFPWERRPEEYNVLQGCAAEGIDPAPIGNYLEMYTIHERPSDYPKDFIIRRQIPVWHCQPKDEPGNPWKADAIERSKRVLPAGAWKAPTLEQARGMVPSGKINIGRQPGDGPQIREVWV